METKRRASEPEASEALALISSNSQHNRIPPPLPYLPSDYRPSPDSPRHFVAAQNALLFNSSPPIPTGKRQRSRSIGYPLAIENAASGSSAPLNNAIAHREHFELVPYREWTVIARNAEKGQLVLYNQDSQSVTVQHYLSDHFANIDPNIPIQVKVDSEEYCPYCHRSMNDSSAQVKTKTNEPNYMDRNYFRLLASSQTNTAANSPVQSRSSTFSTDAEHPPSATAQNLNANAFNQGYYSKFFVEINKLGKGFRGSVFLCEHMLDGVKLGKYAVKKVAIGNNHPWLVRMLREVHLLERLRHPNIVSYKHSWLEYNRLTPFGPEVPCLFILMECANGGNLEEYFEHMTKPEKTSETSKQPKKRMSSKELKRERIRKQYQAQESFEKEQDVSSSSSSSSASRRLLTMTEIWSLFLDIVQGLAHLHQQNIVHRDLKPPNLLLQYDDRNRHGHQGIPRVLISDFGECEDLDNTQVDDNRTGATGTLEFMAPEHVRLDPRGRNTVDYSPKADMWSLGMVLYFLCYSRLPYSIIDDVDVLRAEILSFKEVWFPSSRLDIYKDNPVLYAEALNNPNITNDIPQEIKMLIRMLLSIDPSKRPSCNEILSKLRNIRRDENASIFQNIPTEWNAPASSSSSSNASANNTSADNAASTTTSAGASVYPASASPIPIPPVTASSVSPHISPLSREAADTLMVDTDGDTLDPGLQEPYASHTGKHRHSSVSDHAQPSSSSKNMLRKRQRLIGKSDADADTEMAEPEDGSPRLLMASMDHMKEARYRCLLDQHYAQILKMATVVLKIASCNYPCSPYSAKPTVLYPVIVFAVLDFWNESSSPNLVLLAIHVAWIMGTTLLTGGLCEVSY